jgi:hypothetical protein
VEQIETSNGEISEIRNLPVDTYIYLYKVELLNLLLLSYALQDTSTSKVPDIKSQMVGFTKKINDAVAGGIIGRRFRLHGSGHPKARENARFLTEIRAGMATFFAMAYIISVSYQNLLKILSADLAILGQRYYLDR